MPTTHPSGSPAAQRRPPHGAPPRAGLRQALASEWTKFYSVRSNVWTLTTMAAATIGIAVLVAATGSLQPDDSIVAASLGNAVPGQIAAGVLGALMVCGEYSSGTIRATLAACPRRLTVLTAKTLIVAALVFVVALAAAAVAYLAGAVFLSGQGHPTGGPVSALPGIALSFVAVAVLGVAAGTALRHPAGAVTAITGVLVLPALVAPLLGSWQRWLAGGSPTAALQKLAQPSDATPETLGSLGGWPTLALVCGYGVAAVTASGWLLRARDS